MNEKLTNDEVEIDLVDLAYHLLDKWRYLLVSFLVGAVLFGAYSYFLITPTYESTAKLYVVSASDDSVVNLSDLNLGTSLTADYEQLMLSYPVLNRDTHLSFHGGKGDSNRSPSMIQYVFDNILQDPPDRRFISLHKHLSFRNVKFRFYAAVFPFLIIRKQCFFQNRIKIAFFQLHFIRPALQSGKHKQLLQNIPQSMNPLLYDPQISLLCLLIVRLCQKLKVTVQRR